ncbi:MAG: tyrosine-type recombinase/integrase [Thermoplasmata archaeon]
MEECLLLCRAPQELPVNASEFQLRKHLRDEILIRLIYETFMRIGELTRVKVEDIDFRNCAIFVSSPKGKAVFKLVNGRRTHVNTIHQPRWVFFSLHTRNLMIRYLGGRRRGYLIVNSSGKRLSTRQAERVVDHYARQAGIQKVIGETKGGRRVSLVTPKALREAGERHTEESGGDRDGTARVAGHSVRTKERYYKVGNFEEDRRIIMRHHPLMKNEEWSAEEGRSRM